MVEKFISETIEINYVDAIIHDPNGRQIIALVPAREIIKFSNDCNPRCVDKKAATCKSMKITLVSNSEEFSLRNNGVCARVYKIIDDKERHVLICTIRKKWSEKEGKYVYVDGITNGGHTRFVIQSALDEELGDKAYVKLGIIISNNDNEENLVDIAIAQNDTVKVQDFSLLNASGELDILKEHLNDYYKNCFLWKENETSDKLENFGTFLALISNLNEKAIKSPQKGKAIIKKILAKKDPKFNINDYTDIINDICRLYNLIELDYNKFMCGVNEKTSKNKDFVHVKKNFRNLYGGYGKATFDDLVKLSNKKAKFSDDMLSFNVPEQFITVFMYAFRKNIMVNKNNNKFMWIKDFEEVFNNVKDSIWASIIEFRCIDTTTGLINVSASTKCNVPVYGRCAGLVDNYIKGF